MTGSPPSSPCPLCGGDAVLVVAHPPPTPVLSNQLWPTEDDARGAPLGTIRLGACLRCSGLLNLDFRAGDVTYTEGYENALHFSASFRRYSEELAGALSRRWGLQGRRLLEIGCGDGAFLGALCQAGGAGTTGLGYDPSHRGGQALPAGVEILRRPFPVECDVSADFICARHVLEHVADPFAFLSALRSSIGDRPDVGLYLEVPDAGYMLRHLAVWDLIYEHPYYFTSTALTALLTRAGFWVDRVDTRFGGQYLGIEAMPSEPSRAHADPREVARWCDDAGHFGSAVDQVVQRWRNELDRLVAVGRRVAVWGIGSKGVTFLSWVGGGDRVVAAVDVNPRKQGLHVPTGHRVIAPHQLPEVRPDVVLVMNGQYRAEVEAELERLGLSVEQRVVDAPPLGSRVR